MKNQIVIHSYHHNNTRKVAEAIAKVIGAEVKTTFEADINEINDCALAGFGAGIDSGKHYKELLDFAEKLPKVNEKKCFIFSTSAVQGEGKVAKDHEALRSILLSKGYVIVGEFSCKGFNTNWILKYFGGMNKGRPNEEDIENAILFASKLLNAKKSA